MSDKASIDAVAARTKVIISTAGPFALIGTCTSCMLQYDHHLFFHAFNKKVACFFYLVCKGTPVIDACVRCSTHYCDITGEGPWIRTVIDQFHDEA